MRIEQINLQNKLGIQQEVYHYTDNGAVSQTML